MILDAVFNISSDLLMLCLPIPMLIKSQLPRKKYVQIKLYTKYHAFPWLLTTG